MVPLLSFLLFINAFAWKLIERTIATQYYLEMLNVFCYYHIFNLYQDQDKNSSTAKTKQSG